MNKSKALWLMFFILLTSQFYSQSEHVVASEGVNIHYSIYGTGIPVLIINGDPGFSSEGFSNLAKKISIGGYKAILYDQRGTGKSSMNKIDSSTITMDLMVADMEAIREDMKIDKWILLGHSFGGIMANYYTAKYPERVQSMIASSSGGVDLQLLDSAQSNLFARLTPMEIDSMVYWSRRRRSGDNTTYASRQFAKFMAPAYVFNKKHVSVIAERLTQGNLEINRIVWDDLRRINYNCKNELININNPVLIIQGREDILSESLATKAHEVFSNSKLVLLDSCGHYGWLDQPEKYFTSIFNFLEKCQLQLENEDKVRKVLSEYILSIYLSDSTMVEQITNSSLQKSGFYFSRRSKDWSYEEMDYASLQHTAATYNKKKWLPEWAPVEIEVFEVKEKIASAKIKAIWGFDYILLSKNKDKWIINKVLWQSYDLEEAQAYFSKLRDKYESETTNFSQN